MATATLWEREKRYNSIYFVGTQFIKWLQGRTETVPAHKSRMMCDLKWKHLRDMCDMILKLGFHTSHWQWHCLRRSRSKVYNPPSLFSHSNHSIVSAEIIMEVIFCFKLPNVIVKVCFQVLLISWHIPGMYHALCMWHVLCW